MWSTCRNSSSSVSAPSSPSRCASRRETLPFLRLAFAGTPEFAARALAALLDAGHHIALVVTQPDRPGGRGMRPVASAVKRLALERSLEVFQPETLRSEGALARLRAAQPRAVVVAAYGLILPQAVLDAAPLGALNIHASLLPRWRGAAPIQRAILAGDAHTGVSIMRMDAGLDTGPVLSRCAIPIAAEDDAQTLHDKLAALGAREIVAALAALEAGRAEPVPQPTAGVTYAAKIAKGESHLDWTRPAGELERAVRAFHPAYATLAGERLRIWRVRPARGRGAPGEVLALPGLIVACGEGALDIAELQRAGGRRMSVVEFLRGRPLAPGERFA